MDQRLHTSIFTFSLTKLRCDIWEENLFGKGGQDLDLLLEMVNLFDDGERCGQAYYLDAVPEFAERFEWLKRTRQNDKLCFVSPETCIFKCLNDELWTAISRAEGHEKKVDIVFYFWYSSDEEGPKKLKLDIAEMEVQI